jgi:RHS repeat-associated protein
VTNQSGTVLSRHDYQAFGEEVYAGTANRTSTDKYSSADNIRQQFTGYERDTESGLDYAQARYYNTKHGRFTSVDPLKASATIRNPQTFNRYSYVLNSPYKFTDPLGLLPLSPGGNSACGNFCSNWDGANSGGAMSSAAAGGKGKSLFNLLVGDIITLDLNIVYDNNFTEAQAKEFLKDQIQDLNNTFSKIQIKFNITWTQGTAERGPDGNYERITSGAVEGAINAFLYYDRKEHYDYNYTNTGTRQIFLRKSANSSLRPLSQRALSHEMGHVFGVIGSLTRTAVSVIGKWGNNQLFNGIDNLTSDAVIDSTLLWLRSDLPVYGVDWVDDYRKVKNTSGADRRYGATNSELSARTPSILDIYRAAAKDIAAQRKR